MFPTSKYSWVRVENFNDKALLEDFLTMTHIEVVDIQVSVVNDRFGFDSLIYTVFYKEID